MGWRVRGERERRAQRWSLVYVTAITEAEEGREEKRGEEEGLQIS